MESNENWPLHGVTTLLPNDKGVIHFSPNANHSTNPSPPPLNNKAQGLTPCMRIMRLSRLLNGFILGHPFSKMNTRSTHYFDVLHQIGPHSPCLACSPMDRGCFSVRLRDNCVDFHLG